MKSVFFITIAATIAATSGTLFAADEPTQALTKAQTDFFESKVRPMLVDKCYKCHSATSEKVKGGLQLDTRNSLLTGGNTGPGFIPGKPAESLLIRAVNGSDPDLQMPPKGEKLTPQQVADLTQWVRMGGPDPRVASAVSTTNAYAGVGRQHWAFQPVKKPSVPDVKTTGWAQTPVDKFILEKLEEKGMKPNPTADKRTLIRRASFDLTGLPPTTDEANDFIADNAPDAFAKVVDRLLASSAYGERWGRHWLDVARYSDTKGDVKRQREDVRYPHAWTYRDYVVDAFNKDKPYNQFIIEQLAADRLPSGSDKSVLAALGFLTLGDRFNGMMPDIINDRIDVTSKAFLGLTVSCARCHDHKFDPIPQKDYYSLYGIFSSSYEPENLPPLKPITITAEYQDYQKKMTELDKQSVELRKEFVGMKKSGGDAKKRKQLQKDQQQLIRQHADLETKHPGVPAKANVLVDSAKPKDSPVFIRGEADNKGDIVPRRFLEILSPAARPTFKNGSGRLDLAQAIASPQNPMTARVLVNRVWTHHFGDGFVSTPDDLGNMASTPTHPKLLDYLSAKFMAEGWSIKKLHREIMLSAVYQQTSATNPRFAELDPENGLLWRANVRRLDFESLRDSILAISGALDRTMGGKPVDLGAEPYTTRRSVYGYIDRRNMPEVMTQFDFANPDAPTGKRHETIVPQQALFMMNSPLVAEQARKLVHRPEFDGLAKEEERVRALYLAIFQRPPTPAEVKMAMEFVDGTPAGVDRPDGSVQVAQLRPREIIRDKNAKKAGKKGMPPPQQAGIRPRAPLGAWEKLAHALFQTNEASFIN